MREAGEIRRSLNTMSTKTAGRDVNTCNAPMCDAENERYTGKPNEVVENPNRRVES